ncbi:MAG: putative membrane protein insertion efficiency factor [Parcubacteria group bacterium ADurb.Bin159]|jgi:hypothetical protein|nr:MAG: putative membrane protein insertion efficiency factor [Parcubacteria group bacterium ADurb.Bin159]
MKKKKVHFLTKIIIGLISVYQKTISPDHGLFKDLYPWGGACRYRPTCSEYAQMALVKYGFLKGSIKSIWRIIRCNPWSSGGWDEP